MDASTWVCCGLVAAFITYRPISFIFCTFSPKVVSFLRRYIYGPQIPRKLRLGPIRGRKFSLNIRGPGVFTPFHVVLAIVVLSINVIVLAISAKNRSLLVWRSGRVLVFNLCILIVSGRQSLFSDSLGISYQFQAFFHRWLGRVVFLVGIAHVVIALVPSHGAGAILSPGSRIAGFTAGSALFALIISSLSSVRQAFYEVFCYCHVLFAAIIIVAGFFHLTPLGVSTPSAILFIVTASMYCFLFSIRTGMFILQRAKATIYHHDGLLKADLNLARPVRVRAGQHIWLRIPSTSHTSFAESHPFTVASWGKIQNGKAKNITLLIDIKAGFTRKLKMLASSESTISQHFNAYIDGPYGLPIKAEEFGTVILYATGIGIGAQLATVKHLLESREAGTAKTQRITLLWEVDHVLVGSDAEKEKYFVVDDTAQQMVKDLLQQDCDRLSKLRLDPAEIFKYKSGWQGAPPEQGYMFRCTRYVRNKPQHVELDLDEDNHSSTDTLRTKYSELNPEASLESQLQHDNCRGRVLVSVCAYPEFADSIRNIAATKDIHLHEHEFRPERWPRLKADQGIAGNRYSAGNKKTLGYANQAAGETTIGYRYPTD